MIRRWQLIAILAACLVGSAIGARGVAVLFGPSSPASAQTSQPIDLGPSVAARGTAPKASPSTDSAIRAAQARVKANPNSPTYFTDLALAYIQKERETSDVSYYTLADKSLDGALNVDSTDYQAINAKSWVALGRHDFVRGAQLARKAITLNKYDPANYGTLGDALANLGDYTGMTAAYQKMVNLKPNLGSYNRASYVRWLYGDLQNATRYMLMAIRAGSTQPENVAWCESQLGDDYFNAGLVLPAEAAYEKALNAFPHYARALAGIANVAIALHHNSRGISYYKQAIAVVPLPQYVIGLGDLYTSLGRTTDAARQYALIAYMNRIFKANGVQFGPEMAQFYADHNQHLGMALSLAREAAKTRNDVATDDTLAWTLYKNGQYAEAWKRESLALRLGTHYAPYFFHAGMIQAALGNVTEAQSYLSSALMLNPNFSVLYVPVAHTELSKLSKAMSTGSKKG